MTPKYEAFVTPAGEAVFPWITKADTAHDPNGVYHVDLSVPAPEAEELIAKLDKVRDEFIATLPSAKARALTARPTYLIEYTRPTYPEDATPEMKAAIRNDWEGEPTGNVLFRMKLKAKVTTQDGTTFEQAPVVVDATTGEKIEVPVYGGSIIRCKGQIVPYTNAAAGIVGVTLRLKAVQVIELQGGSGEGDGSFWTDFDSEAA